jgi:hypothetical protein
MPGRILPYRSPKIRELARGFFYSLEFDPSSTETLFASTDVGIAKSLDGGCNWTVVAEAGAASIAADPLGAIEGSCRSRRSCDVSRKTSATKAQRIPAGDHADFSCLGFAGIFSRAGFGRKSLSRGWNHSG